MQLGWRRAWVVLVVAVVGLGILGSFVGGCALLSPLPPQSTLEERLAVFPTDNLPLVGAVTVHWDRHQIPFIEAEHDDDAAFALGLVHAHLRLGQMAMFKRIAHGRIAEMGGPLASEIDHGIRILNFARAVDEIEAALPPATRAWLTRFVAGINTYQERAAVLPVEYRILGMEPEPWTVADVLTFGRLAGTDFNWIVWFSLLKLHDREDWPEIWSRIVRDGTPTVPPSGAGAARLGALLAGLSRSGSNSMAIAPSRSRSGAALIASDPHLGISIPNVWLLAGLKSPSYHAVGLMVPGLPIFAIGRNPWIAWGGTNMRAMSSTLVDVSQVPDDEIRERRERIGVRWWFDREVIIRETPYGPILSDAPQLQGIRAPAFALRWTGHDVSDEISAMLAASRARTFEQYREAFRTFAVPGQNMLYADTSGTIAEVMAVQLPAAKEALPGQLIASPAAAAAWRAVRGAADFPVRTNPAEGFLASANNRPVANKDLAIGAFFSPDDRVARMAQFGAAARTIGPEDLGRLQQDVYMASAAALRDLIIARLDALGIAAGVGPEEGKIVDLLRNWDGHFHHDSRGALAYELFRNRFTEGFYAGRLGAEDWAAFASVAGVQGLLLGDIAEMDPEELAPLLRDSLSGAAADIAGLHQWGDIHRLGLNHPLSFLPVIGGRFRFSEHPIGGSNETLMKTAHGTTSERHTVRYGSNARHVSDLSDMDRNDFTLLGGQDGWINSTTSLDQVPLWLEGRPVQLPLRLETVRARFPHRVELRSAAGG
jgi:penicillin G amidase